MPRVIVETDDGRRVWEFETTARMASAVWRPGTHEGASSLLSGLERAVADAEVVERGGDPERPSEKAMRLAMEAS